MTECYRYAMDTYEQMTDAKKAKISLELLYNAMCYFHGDALEIVQKLLRIDQTSLSQFGASLAATRQHVKQMHQTALAAMPALSQSAFASRDVEDILFYRIANGLPIA